MTVCDARHNLQNVLQVQTSFQCLGCREACVFTTGNGTFSDGSGSASYDSYATCEWMIAPPGALEISLLFTMFSTEPLKDIVRVLECKDYSCSQRKHLAQLSGLYASRQVIVSATGFMSIVFTSDGSNNFDGFVANWTSVGTVMLEIA